MKIGMIDCDNKNHRFEKNFYPNLPLMKLSAWHKQQGDTVEMWSPDAEYYDKVYISKVFTWSQEPFIGNCKNIERGGTGYAIKIENGVEVYHAELDGKLPPEIEHIYPDYDLYGIKDTAYGFLQRGCPRNCGFCPVSDIQGKKPHRVARLDEFWRGQKNIVLLDPNITSCPEWESMFDELIASGAYVNFSQGIDLLTLDEKKINKLKQIKLKGGIHFAWDRYEDKEKIIPKMKLVKELTGWYRATVTVYVLTNYNTTIEQDLERIYTIRSFGFHPYVQRYNKQALPRGCEQNKLAKWCNFHALFYKYETFEDFKYATYATYRRQIDEQRKRSRPCVRSLFTTDRML